MDEIKVPSLWVGPAWLRIAVVAGAHTRVCTHTHTHTHVFAIHHKGESGEAGKTGQQEWHRGKDPGPPGGRSEKPAWPQSVARPCLASPCMLAAEQGPAEDRRRLSTRGQMLKTRGVSLSSWKKDIKSPFPAGASLRTPRAGRLFTVRRPADCGADVPQPPRDIAETLGRSAGLCLGNDGGAGEPMERGLW